MVYPFLMKQNCEILQKINLDEKNILVLETSENRTLSSQNQQFKLCIGNAL